MPGDNIDQTRSTAAGERKRDETEHLVDETVEESFPASDPPAWTTSGSLSAAAQHSSEALHDALKPLDQGLNMNTESSIRHIADAASSVARDLYRRGETHIPNSWRQGAAVMHSEHYGLDAVRHRIVEHPFAAIAVAGAIGCALGWLIGGRSSTSPQPQWRPVYNPRHGAAQERHWAPGTSRPMNRSGGFVSSAEAASHTNNSF